MGTNRKWSVDERRVGSDYEYLLELHTERFHADNGIH